MSSGRDSVGDLIPPDMLQIFTEERQGGKHSRRKPASLTRAFKWLKRQRRKQRQHAKEIRDLLTPGSPVELPLSALNTENAVGSHPLQEFQENVFVEGNRPKYVLDLHTEAQQGLKLLQQEEDKNGTDFPDDRSMISTVTTRTDDSRAFSELGGFESESTAVDSISMRSSISTRSTRSGLKRQASTFRPLKPDKTQQKTKSHRKHVRNVVGIPRHVQKELGLDRAAWITTNLDAQLPNGAAVLPAIVSTVDGGYTTSEQDSIQGYLQGVENSLARLPALAKPNGDGTLKRIMNNPIDPERSGTGVPLLTTSGNPAENSPSAVMSISPQATYMSKIIPNAFLPPAVDVVELSRGPSRSSVRMVSKSSLVAASPASTRASTKVSSHRSTDRSNCSGWSRSESSETLVSDSSTISSSSTPRVASRESQVENTSKPDKIKTQNYSSHNASTNVNGDTTDKENNGKAESGGALTWNLSVMKKTKRPPAPPSRSYSLHNGKQSRNRSESPSYSTSQELRHNRIISPYSSQLDENGPSTYLSKKNQPHSCTNGNSKLVEFRKTLLSAKSLLNGKTHSPAVMALCSLLDIPEHPKVLAPPAPPPETWAHNQRTFELLCGPGPVNYARWAKKRGLKIVDVPQPGALTNKHDSVKTLPVLQTAAEPPSPPPDTVDMPLSPAEQAIKLLTAWIPPHPLFPPPAPPVEPVSALSGAVQNDTIIPPPPQFSHQSVLTMLQLTSDVPPPPQDVPPPPPQTKIVPPPQVPLPPPLPHVPPPLQILPPQVILPPQHHDPPPQEIPPSPPLAPKKIPPPPQEAKHTIISTLTASHQAIVPLAPPLPTDIKIPSPPREAKHTIISTSTASQQAHVPPAPPLPPDIKKEAKLVTTVKEEKRSSSPIMAKEETSSPMVTQSLLQMVRLRSVKSNHSQVVGLDKSSNPTQKSSASQDAPPKPVRRSLIITALPPDVEALTSTEPKTEDSPPNVLINKTVASETQQGSSEQVNIVQNAQNMGLQPLCSLATRELTEPDNKTASAEPATEQPSNDPELKPQNLKIQLKAPEPATLQSTTEPKDAFNTSQPKTQLHTQETNKTNHNAVKQAIIIEAPSKPESDRPETQSFSFNLPVHSSTPPVISPPANPSMRLQDAIRLKAAALSTKDNQVKRFGLRSPPPATGGNIAPISPASTASFIFSKNTKRVVMETELSSDSFKPHGSHMTATKVPPPVAIKPKAKVESAAESVAE